MRPLLRQWLGTAMIIMIVDSSLTGCAGFQPMPDESGHVQVQCQDMESMCYTAAEHACGGHFTVLERQRTPIGPSFEKPEFGVNRASFTMDVQCER